MNEHWLNRDRLRVYPRLFAAVYVLAAVIWIAMSDHGVDRYQKPLGYDFITYWSASQLARTGDPARAYDMAAIVAQEHQLIPGIRSVNPWMYPPTFFLLILPLSLLPYFLSYFAWIGTTYAAYFTVVRRIVAVPGSLLPLLAFPGGFINFVQGQNGFLTAALIGGAMLLLPTQPAWAGVLIGLLTIKPQLGLLLPLALLCGRQWRALFFACLTAVAFLLTSVAVLGPDTLADFLGAMGRFSVLGVRDPDLLVKIPSFFAFAYLLGAPAWMAGALQLAVAAGVAVTTGWIWLKCRSHDLRAAALVSGSLLASPYLLDYDLAWLALPLAWFAVRGMRCGWLRGERELLAAAWVLPLVMVAIYKLFRVQLAPFVLLGLFLAILRRTRREVTSGVAATGV